MILFFIHFRQYRLAAYRQFVCWMMKGQKLGKGQRVPISSCVLEKNSRNFSRDRLESVLRVQVCYT